MLDVYDWQRTTTGFYCFSGTLVGDTFFVASYLPYHAFNMYQLIVMGRTPSEITSDGGNSRLCEFASFFSAFSVMVSFSGIVLVANTTLTMVSEGVKFKKYKAK